VLELLLRKRSQERAQGISILYITPLRALNRDIFRRLIEVGERLDIRIEVRHGDTSKQARRLQALKPPDMLITTPETFQAIMPGTRMRRHLQGTRWIIIDEIHELITDERGAQLSIGLERLEEITGTKYQRIGLSATVGNEDQVGQFLVGTNNTVRVLRTVETKDIEVTVESPSSQPEDERLAQDLMVSSSSVARIKRIIELVNSHQSVLIFTNTREHAETLSSRILALQPDARIGIHHGSLSK
ncbi:DEAD/DEAH box helicase, partial [Candidatus Bathyarchaeota archaeon]|nr:DEAD/DEAH box helicase [Candidatus Bathyarchaeota archaeon]